MTESAATTGNMTGSITWRNGMTESALEKVLKDGLGAPTEQHRLRYLIDAILERQTKHSINIEVVEGDYLVITLVEYTGDSGIVYTLNRSARHSDLDEALATLLLQLPEPEPVRKVFGGIEFELVRSNVSTAKAGEWVSHYANHIESCGWDIEQDDSFDVYRVVNDAPETDPVREVLRSVVKWGRTGGRNCCGCSHLAEGHKAECIFTKAERVLAQEKP